MTWRLPWAGAKDAERVEAQPVEMGEAVAEMIRSQHDTFKARLRGRAAYLRAKALLTDSISDKHDLLVEAAANEWHLKDMGE